jgi:F0F1-type ATP synthase assembly protein I
MLVTIAFGVFIGVKLDEKYPNQYSTFTIIFSLLFIGIALYSVIKQVTKFSNQKNNSK